MTNEETLAHFIGRQYLYQKTTVAVVVAVKLNLPTRMVEQTTIRLEFLLMGDFRAMTFRKTYLWEEDDRKRGEVFDHRGQFVPYFGPDLPDAYRAD